MLPGFTAPKILWLKKHEPKNYQRLATVLLPHDYLNFWLTGERVMEYGDASGSALLDVRKRKWSTAAIDAIDPELAGKLPRLISSDEPAGRLQASTARMLSLNTDVVVSAGGGDNMMGAIGTGNTRAGVITASFGTSGTIYACAEKPVVDPLGEIAAFCDSTNRWLPLLCTMNVTVATEMVRADFGWSHERFAAESARVPAGSGGLLLLPYFEGERTPNVPEGTGVWFGVNQKTFEAGHFARATMEGVTLGMNYGLRRLSKLGVVPSQIRATGGGARSKVWRQIMADVFNAEVVTLKVSEGAAYGAALQALWCWRRRTGGEDRHPGHHRPVHRSEPQRDGAAGKTKRRGLWGIAGAPGRDVGQLARGLCEASEVCHPRSGTRKPTRPGQGEVGCKMEFLAPAVRRNSKAHMASCPVLVVSRRRMPPRPAHSRTGLFCPFSWGEGRDEGELHA